MIKTVSCLLSVWDNGKTCHKHHKVRMEAVWTFIHSTLVYIIIKGIMFIFESRSNTDGT